MKKVSSANAQKKTVSILNEKPYINYVAGGMLFLYFRGRRRVRTHFDLQVEHHFRSIFSEEVELFAEKRSYKLKIKRTPNKRSGTVRELYYINEFGHRCLRSIHLYPDGVGVIKFYSDFMNEDGTLKNNATTLSELAEQLRKAA